MAKTNIEQLRLAQWDKVEKEVVMKIRILRAACEKLEPNPLNDKIAEDLFLPALSLLGEFCMRIKFDDEGVKA
jgi:hypothetical protein